MPERPTDPPEYGWLYGAKGGDKSGDAAPGPSYDDPEPTRMMPTIKRPEAKRTQQPPAVPPRRPIAPTPAPAGRPRRHRSLVGMILKLAIPLWIVFMLAVPALAWGRIDKVDITPAGSRPAEQPGTTYLLVGSDSRKGLSPEDNKRMGTGGVGDVGQRTDTIMLIHTGSGPSLLLSIPRDSLVAVPGHGTTKINSAFAFGGPKLLVQTIEKNTGLRIDHYAEIGFGGFVNSVDAVGGIQICPTTNMNDRRANLNIKKGCQHVDGVTALGYARSRHTSGLSDIDRAKHQREVVSAIGSEVKSPWTFINPLRYFRVNNAATSSLKISEGSGPAALAKMGLAMTRVDGASGKTCSMPIRDLAVHWDRERALALLKLIKEDRVGDIPARLCSPTGLNQ